MFVETEDSPLNNNQVFTLIYKHESYKYFGMVQTSRIESTVIKGNLNRDFENRINMILKTKLNTEKISRAIL